ncbi:MAG: AAA family ATPase [Desulfuromonas sp.]|uniref:AAA family ATPase n=1 Tax=Desulfuromonas sp. TaxID=892 RepID=UPI000CABAE7C|nr:AAA family ATPase [Desulfuromonas sp.]PLX81691.1 MAG: AAA family ATPase [Desulfuromonas sp.]
MVKDFSLSAFSRLVAAGTPLLYITTDSESRTEALITRAALQRLKGVPVPQVWNCTAGFPGKNNDADPLSCLRWAIEQEGPGIFVFKDMHWFWDDNPYLQRVLKDFAAVRRPAGKTLVFLGAEPEIPPALREDFLILDHGLPDRLEIMAFLEAQRKKDPFLEQILAEEDALPRLTLAAQGLDLSDFDQALRRARVAKGAGLKEVVASLHLNKKQILRRSGIMEFVENEVQPEHVGGMENLKTWLEKREKAFGTTVLSAGHNLPKGVLIMGISGCGKSLFVKAIASRWNLPLVRLDMATVYEGTFGSPEGSLRRACKTAEALAPCVLWIDEIEAGISNQGFKSEGGPASRVLGYFLTWMQEKSQPVFVAATANAIELLPAEVLRKGRFDEIFYMALPSLVEREEIFRIHLEKRDFDPAAFDVTMLAHSAKGFSGAEIEQAVDNASFEALAKGRPMIKQDLMEAISRTVPLSVTMAEQIKKIEAWAFKRAVPASKTEKT